MINIILLVASLILYGQTIPCEICIIDSTCTNDYIYFNISISNKCEYPLDAVFSYDTDIDSEKHYVNTTFDCRDCHTDLTIDSIHDAWDYTLTLESPEPTKTCPAVRIAHCGGAASRYVWFATAGLSGLFAFFGLILCSIRYCRTQRQQNTKKKTIQVAVINA